MINFKNYINGIFLTLIFFVLLSLKNLTVFADQKNNLEKNPTSCEIQENKIICFNIKTNNNFHVNLLDDPYRILINFKNKFSFNNKNIKTNKLIKNVRFNKKNIDGARLVIELRQPAIITDIIYDKLNSEDFINLQILLSKTTVTNFAVAKHILKENDGKFLNFKQSLKFKLIEMPEEETKRLINNTSKEKYIVFIDPGHGGRDPGAIGRLGTLEKNITLKTSIMLKKALKRYKNINSILSRDKDIYLSLKERTKLAKINNADIFISLHADSSKNNKANGISVFSLSDKASDKEARMLAKRENDVDNFLGNKNKIKDPIIYNTLIKMFQRKAMNDSSYLAKKILSNLEKTKLAVNRGHRFAGFAVLKSYEIPSVLIEIGFLSNKQEEKKMLNTKYLNELSNGLAIAIGSYFDSYKE
ncbi:MAG: N-acetylmuramoyl-L-alanine amidase [Candidatus Puniceispirillales bacterium]